MKDVRIWETPYSREIALAGLQWVRDLQSQLEPPSPERPKQFCKDFCEFYDESGLNGCPSK
jgi:hypothetical protein